VKGENYMPYIIRNCPCIIEFKNTHLCAELNNVDELKQLCQNCTNCLLKRIYEDVKTVYRTPEYFEELDKKGDGDQELIESAWHNVAHMVISKLDIQEVE
jgi:hypothetical protein